MKKTRNLLPALAVAAILWLGAPLVTPAAAQGFNSWEGSEEIDTPARAFLRKHGKLVFGAVPVLMFILYIVIMGPADMLDAARRGQRRGRFGGYKGFGNNGGFGGNITMKNPWE